MRTLLAILTFLVSVGQSGIVMGQRGSAARQTDHVNDYFPGPVAQEAHLSTAELKLA